MALYFLAYMLLIVNLVINIFKLFSNFFQIMKKILTLCLLVGFVCTIQAAPYVDAKTKNAIGIIKKEGVQPELLSGFSVDHFVEMSAKDVKEKLGRKPKLKEVIAIKAAQKKIKKAYKKNAPGEKEQLTAFLLAILIGGLGVHRFYLGYTGIGIAQLLTLGGCGIWTLIDVIRIATDDMLDADGNELIPW